ncbi:MAG: hypothetical protein JXQ67_04260 [Campylobacterales bacterium]|nr:hypothetical protein [Campylobacterales bacterium]
MTKTILLLALIFNALYAQKSDFSVIIDKPFNAALFDITEDYDRSISAVGFSKEFKKNSNVAKTYTNAFEYLASVSKQHGSQMQLIKVNKQAEIELSKLAQLNRFNEAIAVVKTPDNGYFVGGYTLDGQLLLAKLDANANTTYTTLFGTKNYDRMNNMILLSDGGVLAVGSSTTSRSQNESLFESGLGNNDIYITRFSKNGTKLWEHKYGTEYDDEGIDAVEAQDGSILILSKTSYDQHKNVTLMRISENGDKIWLKHYKGEKLVLPTRIIRLRDNNFIVSLIVYDEMRKEHIRLIKFDLYKNVLLDKEIFTTYPSGLNDIAEFSDGTLMGVGYVKDIHNTDALAMLIDSNLAMLRQEHYGDENYDNFYSLKILHDSKVGVAGVYTANESQETNMWIAKLNRDTTMAQISLQSENFYEQLYQYFAPEIKAQKIAIDEDLTIRLIKKNLYFAQGSYKLTEEQKLFLNSFSPKLMRFLFAHNELIRSLEINGHTSTEWGNTDFAHSYINNEKLSMERSFTTISYMFKQENSDVQKWLTRVLKGSGLSYSKYIVKNELEDKEKSRRVNFKIILK